MQSFMQPKTLQICRGKWKVEGENTHLEDTRMQHASICAVACLPDTLDKFACNYL